MEVLQKRNSSQCSLFVYENANWNELEGKFPGEKKGSFDRKSKGGKSSVSRKKSGFKPGGKKTFKKKF